MVNVVKSASEFKESLKHDGLVVVDFFATWCGPCRTIAPTVDKFAEEYPTALFIKVDVDELQEVAQEYLVAAMPTFLLFKEAKVVQKVVGANSSALKKAINDNI